MSLGGACAARWGVAAENTSAWGRAAPPSRASQPGAHAAGALPAHGHHTHAHTRKHTHTLSRLMSFRTVQ